MDQTLGVHETLDMHEILMFKNICLTKSATMSAIAQDPALKELLGQDAKRAKQDIEQLMSLLGREEK